MLDLVVHLHLDIFVAALVTGCQTLVHGLGIDEEFERGTRLAHGHHLVIFPRVEVDVAHPGLHVSCLRFHRNETAVHEPDHIADAVHR